jgi:DNA-binding SARP family transcriptional activator
VALTIHLLGGFRITTEDQEVAGLEHARLRELLAYLLQRGLPLSRQHLAFFLWPDSGKKQARSNLRNLWHRLRRTLPDAGRFIDADKAAIQ